MAYLFADEMMVYISDPKNSTGGTPTSGKYFQHSSGSKKKHKKVFLLYFYVCLEKQKQTSIYIQKLNKRFEFNNYFILNTKI